MRQRPEAAAVPVRKWRNAQQDVSAAELDHLLLHRLTLTRSQLLRSGNATLSPAQQQQLDADCARLRAGEPLGYVLGVQPFRDIELQVDARVLVPRPETELLVDAVLEQVADVAPSILELGTGSGAIAISLALALAGRSGTQVTATDTSADALAVAKLNAASCQAPVAFICADWYRGVDGRYDVIVSNPPYIAEDDPHLPDLQHEPLAALISGADGLQALRHIVAEAPQHLNAGGALFVEHGYDQGSAVRELFREAGFQQVHTARDYSNHERISHGLMEAGA